MGEDDSEDYVYIRQLNKIKVGFLIVLSSPWKPKTGMQNTALVLCQKQKHE